MSDIEGTIEVAIRPQPKQEEMLASAADICLGGGAAGSGKTFTILAHPLRWLLTVPNFRGVIFRRTTPQIRAPGGIWDAAVELYSQFPELVLRGSSLEVVNPALNSKLVFAHLEQAKDVLNWQGTELAFIGFDELTHFTASQFWYMMSRARSTCGLQPYIFSTCNPEADHWLTEFVDWYLYPKAHAMAGTPNPDKSGVFRWFVRINGVLHWSESKEELITRFGEETEPKSFTFISSSIYDNKILLAKDKGYLSNLKALPLVERMRLLEQNWYVRADAGMFFRKEWFDIIKRTELPKGIFWIRYWDRAATEPSQSNPDPDWTAGTRVGRHPGTGDFYVDDVIRIRAKPGTVQTTITDAAESDTHYVQVALERDPGSAGLSEIAGYKSLLDPLGYVVNVVTATKAKATRCLNASAAAEFGKIHVVRSSWTEDFIDECQNFTGLGNCHDDQVDTLSGAVNLLMELVPCAAFASAFGAEREFQYNKYTKEIK